MAALFLASYGKASGRTELVDEAAKQFLVHAHYLADPRDRLCGSTAGPSTVRHNFAEARWARGNAWITVGILDLMELAAYTPPVRDFLLAILGSQIDALLPTASAAPAHGAPCWTIATSYEEISATAGFGYGLLESARGWASAPTAAAQAGLQALATR